MRKRLLCVLVLLWIAAVSAIMFAGGAIRDRKTEGCFYDSGCVSDDRIFVTENREEEGILYVMDPSGNVEKVFLTEAIQKKSKIKGIKYADAIYGVLVWKDTIEDRNEYQIVQFDDQGNPARVTPGIYAGQEGTLTGFSVDETGFYLTFILKAGERTGVCFIGKQELLEYAAVKAAEEKPEALELEFYELAVCEEERFFIKARYENGNFLLWKDDGSGSEYFKEAEVLSETFQKKKLTVGQYLTVERDICMFYLRLFMIGIFVIVLLYMALRNRSHMVYMALITEGMLLVIVFSGAFYALHLRCSAQRETTEQASFYYLQVLSEEIGNPADLAIEQEGFYTGSGYYAIQKCLKKFAGRDGLPEVFKDICLVRSSDHQILVSFSGHNGPRFENVYSEASAAYLKSLAGGENPPDVLMRMDGQPYRIFGIPVFDGRNPDYLLMAVTDRKETVGLEDKSTRDYLLGTGGIFLAASIACTIILLFQDRELNQLAAAMQKMAGGQTNIRKTGTWGRDVDFMWNSLQEIGKNISRTNYVKFRTFESCYRFAPKNIEMILGKNSITEVEDGDMALLHGTVAIISSGEPGGDNQKTSDTMNRLITLVEKHREAKKGFFVSGQYNLTKLNVLFLDDSRESINFGVSFLHEFYEDKFIESLHTGILLHYSEYLYGVAGTNQQSFPFLLSKEVDKLEKYAEWFRRMNIRMVITESVKVREESGAALRYIGYIRGGESQEKLSLYEVVDACSLRKRSLKLETNQKFQKALELFYQHDFYLARSTFSDVLKEDPEDQMAKWYLFTCEKYLNEPCTDGDACELRPDSQFVL